MQHLDSSDIARAIMEDRAAVAAGNPIMKATLPRTRKAVWNDAVRRLLALGKNMPSSAVDALDDALPEFNSDVADGIMGGYLNRIPSRAEIPISPVTAASGGGAESLIEWSSDITPQEGITRLYNEFSKLLKRFDELGKSQLRLAEGVAAFVKATDERFPDSEQKVADEDDDSDSDEKKIEKALAGLGMRHGGVRDVIEAFRCKPVENAARFLQGGTGEGRCERSHSRKSQH
jgi:hypothetical protein